MSITEVLSVGIFKDDQISYISTLDDGLFTERLMIAANNWFNVFLGQTHFIVSANTFPTGLLQLILLFLDIRLEGAFHGRTGHCLIILLRWVDYKQRRVILFSFLSCFPVITVIDIAFAAAVFAFVLKHIIFCCGFWLQEVLFPLRWKVRLKERVDVLRLLSHWFKAKLIGISSDCLSG